MIHGGFSPTVLVAHDLHFSEWFILRGATSLRSYYAAVEGFCYAIYGIIEMTNRNTDFRLRDLRMLSVALRERSLTRAAEVLDMSQPTLSKSLARLRRHFGDPLLVRSGNEMHPTPKAVEIEGALKTLLATADDLVLRLGQGSRLKPAHGGG